MKKVVTGLGLALVLLVTGCSLLPRQADRWLDFISAVDGMSDAQLAQSREALRSKYHAQPDDETRLRLAYLLSRSQPSRQQLQESRSLLREIDSDGPQATLRDLQDREIELQLQLQQANGEVLTLRAQLEALKKIEGDLAREQEDTP